MQREGISTIEPTIISPSGIPRDALDPDALRSVERLQERDFEAYFVGGCVRDLLLQRSPKDFDINTSARPQQVKRTFPRNCRIIGRRFKLAHLHFHQNQKILEVATFRAAPLENEEESEDLLITRDNEFGTAEEDARRRDFTVNALFLDPHDDSVIDYVGGLEDLRARQLRTIGAPVTRFREDPVRILRAAKFAGRLGFTIEDETYAAMREVAPDLSRAAPPRLLEEILRLLRGGHALASFQILRDIGALKVILPIVGTYLEEAPTEDRVVFWRLLDALDARCLATSAVAPTPILLGALFVRPVLRRFEREGRRSATTLAEEMLGPLSLDLRLPRRDAGSLKRICGVQPRFTATGTKRFRVASFLHDTHFGEALTLFELHCQARGEGFEDLERWRKLAAETRSEHYDDSDSDDPDSDDSDARDPESGERSTETVGDRPGARKRRRRSRGGRGRRDRADATAERSGERSAERTSASGTERSAAEAPPAKKSKRSRRRGKADGDEEVGQGRGRSTKKTARTRKRKEREAPNRGKARRGDKVETIEPEVEDLTAFDLELDPKRVPTFGVLVEDDKGRKRARMRAPSDSDPYKPPPPPDRDAPPTPPPPPDEEFGDW